VTDLFFRHKPAVQKSGVAAAVSSCTIEAARKGRAGLAKKSPSMRRDPKRVPWLGIWLNCAVPAVVSKVFPVMEVLGRVTVKMADLWVNCVSLDWV